ncbi:MAG TPA: GspH/FimT family pseudopilin [Nevskiales bacterium]|nr:GspH/FimT family pseudopilin [Nevskiales bacterium]
MVMLPSRQEGFTVIELMIVLLVVGVLATIAAPSFSGMIAKNRVKAASSNLHLSLLKARSEAAKRNASITVSPNAGGWVSGWRVLAGATVLAQEGPVSGVTITTDPNPLPSVVYLSSGRTQGGASVTFEVEDSGDILPDRDLRCVVLSLSGMPAVKEGPC